MSYGRKDFFVQARKCYFLNIGVEGFELQKDWEPQRFKEGNSTRKNYFISYSSDFSYIRVHSLLN